LIAELSALEAGEYPTEFEVLVSDENSAAEGSRAPEGSPAGEDPQLECAGNLLDLHNAE
jgi:hypothetical protein